MMRAILIVITILIMLHLGGCVVVEYQDETRRVLIMRGLTDTGIEGFSASTPNGTTVDLQGYTSDQAKIIDLAKAALEAAK